MPRARPGASCPEELSRLEAASHPEQEGASVLVPSLNRVLRLTVLTPNIVEAILDGRRPGGRVTGHESQTMSMAHRLSTER
jgi:hypothetical protein